VRSSFLIEPIDLPWSKIFLKSVDKGTANKIAEVAFINVISLVVHIVLPCQTSRATINQWTTYRVRVS
jgi:hypothetical protein